MKKLLSLFLSFLLIMSSCSPAYCEGAIVRRAITDLVTDNLRSGSAFTFSNAMEIGLYNSFVETLPSQHSMLFEQLSQSMDIAAYIPQNLDLSTFLSAVSTQELTGPAEDVGLFLSRMSLAGLVATEEDLPVLKQIKQKFENTFLDPIVTMTLGRIYARVGMYSELNELILEEKPSGQFWVDLKDLSNESGEHVTAPVGVVVGPSVLLDETYQPLRDYLKQYGPLTTLSGNFSKDATRLYIDLGKIPTEDLLSQMSWADTKDPFGQVKAIVQGISRKETVSPIVLPNTPVTSLPIAGGVGVQTDLPEAPFLQSAHVSPDDPEVTPSWTERAVGQISRMTDWVRNTITPSKADNKQAMMVLNKPQPLPTRLRDIVLSGASASLKIQALLKLYEQGIFHNFLALQPDAVKDHVLNAKTETQRGRALYRLYQTQYLKDVLNAITDVQEQGSVLKELEAVLSQKGFEEEASRAYAAEDRLPLKGSNFNGAVPSVPEADKEVILGVVRPAGYAKSNASAGSATKKGTYYKNNIPFYYRNSKGELSSEPVGILTQVPASLYGRVLSALHLAGQPGFTVPEGMVLALDEKGQWKFFTPKGNLAVVEANKYSQKVMQQVDKNGSARVHLDTNYSTTDLLAMAHLLEANPTLNLELALNTPHSLDQFLTAHAFFVGNDAGNTLTGPFKESLKTMAQGVVNMVTNLLGGIGYFTPIAGGYAVPTMAKLGNAKTTQLIYGMAAGALAYSVFGLGMYGTVDPTSLPLAALAIPTVALVLGASLANSFIPTFLNFYKDPAARTAANLDFSTKKQVSRLALSGIIALSMKAGLNWTIVAPVGLGLLGASYALFRNTPMYRDSAKGVQKKKDPNEPEYIQEYKDFRNQLSEMKDIKSRVKMVYASYAASLMVLGQSANAVLPGGWGQGFITACMLATLGVRKLATRLVKKNIMTDDQLTGLSLPTLALSGLALALLPFSGPLAALTGAAGILHYMATAVPGQLDAARMQNIVTAEMQQRKQKVLDDATLTPNEKEEAIKRLDAEEKVWSAQASKDYSLYNSRGLWGIGIAAAAAFLFEDLGPQWTQQVLEWVSNIYPGSTSTLSLDRLLFGYSAGVASVLAMKNLPMTRDGINFFRKKKPITTENIEDGLIASKEFGITKNNAQIQLGDITGKRMKELEPKLVDYGMYSEQKMTGILVQLQSIHNRLVAIGEILGTDITRAAFQREADMVKKFADIISQPQNDFSVMLHREFDKIQKALLEDGAVREAPSYVEENIYKLPAEYSSYESARRLLAEMDQMAYTLQTGSVIDYQQFVDYVLRAREELIIYEKANTTDSIRVQELERKIDSLCALLAQQDEEKGLLDILPTDTPTNKAGKQALRDMLRGYKKP